MQVCDAKDHLRVVGVKGGRASRSGAQPQASTERVSTRRSGTLDAHVALQPIGGVQGMFYPCTLALRRERSSKRQRLLVKPCKGAKPKQSPAAR